jgi:hypothetical protein
MEQRGYWSSRAHVYGLGLLLGVLWSISTAFVVGTLPDEADEIPLVQWSFTMLPVLAFVAGVLATLLGPGRRILPWGPGWLAAAEAGAVVAFIGFAMHDLTYLIVQNAFYDMWLKQNPDMVASFPSSGFSSIAVYGTVKTLQFFIPLLIAHSLFGAVCGAVGGLLARLIPIRRPAAPAA